MFGSALSSGILGVFLLIGASAFAACPNMGIKNNEPPGNLLPGNYFEFKARSYLKRNDLKSAMDMYKVAAYWGNKYAQHNVGILYLMGGASVAQDRSRATAWLRLAAQSRQPEMTEVYNRISLSLASAEREQADAVWNELQSKYGDTVTRQRAITRYQTERRNVTGSRVGFVGSLTLCLPDGNEVSGTTYYSQMDKLFEAYVDTMFGHAEVGPLVPMSEPPPPEN